MEYYVGIDGGGTKTAFCLLDENGNLIKSLKKGGTSYKHIEWEIVINTIVQGVDELLAKENYCREKVSVCAGIPNYGESKKNDVRMNEQLRNAMRGFHLHIVNDSEVGWAGSLGLEAGINIVSGTGSIAFGKNEAGEAGVSGGWSDFFGDEGSCRWIGVKAMEYFSKEADGRFLKGPLYDLMLKEFQVEDAVDVIDIFEEKYQPFRSRLAKLQMVAGQAARQGDERAVSLYSEAAKELALLILSLYQKLKFSDRCTVSYSGGLFAAGDLILRPLERELQLYNMKLVPPLYEPVIGAALIAAQKMERTVKGGTLCILQSKK